jgi:nucleoside-diphosphate-sugar epimerase
VQRDDNKPRVALIGCGDIGIALARRLVLQDYRCLGLRRSPPAGTEGMQWLAADYTEVSDLQPMIEWKPDYLVITLKPAAYTEAGYQQGYVAGAQAIAKAISGCKLKRVFYVSSTRVYGESDGGWVDETSPLATDGYAALALIAAEQTIAAAADTTLIRCAGIYDGAATFYRSRIERGLWSRSEPVIYTNRIHRADCVGFLAHLIHLEQQGKALQPVYNAADNRPAPRHQLERWLADQLGLIPPNDASVPAQSPESHKRVSNEALKASGYSLRYTSFEEGYAAEPSKR